MTQMNYFLLSAAMLATWLTTPELRAQSVFSNDLDAARQQAKMEHKDVFVDFTGSDWCGFCLKLDKEVFETPEFKSGAPAHFVSVQLDFPQKIKLSPEVTAKNKAWKSELGSRSFPDALLLDENGRVYARTGYRPGGPAAYLEHLESLRQRRIQRDSAFTAANNATGIERAKHLDVAISALRNEELVMEYYSDTVKEIRTLDPDNKAGLITKYDDVTKRRKCEHEIDRLCTGDDGAAMLAKLKEYAAKSDIPAESKQHALYMAACVPCERLLHDNPQAIELLNQAIAAAPNSELAEDTLKRAKERLEKKLSAPKPITR